MPSSPRVLVSPSAQVRRRLALEWLAARGPSERVCVVGATVEAAFDLVREASKARAAAFGWQRTTLARLAAEFAQGRLAERGLVPVGGLALESVCHRLVFELGQAGALGSLQPVAGKPGLARALGRTLSELRLEGANPREVEAARGDLGRLLELFEAALAREALADRAEVLLHAAQAVRAAGAPAGVPLLFLDVPVVHRRERELVQALVSGVTSGDVLAIAPFGDERTIAQLELATGARPEVVQPGGDEPLAGVQRQLFGVAQGLAQTSAVSVLSAPGEHRESVEIARRILAEVRAGTPFDQIAILTRSNNTHRVALEEALSRARIPMYLARGTERPDPSGRALLALLRCAEEGLSASAFAEYLALGEVPREEGVRANEELQLQPEGDAGEADAGEGSVPEAAEVRAPWRWEKVLLDAAVIGGLDRWRRRIAGRARLIERQIKKLSEDDATDEGKPHPEREHKERELSHLRELEAFALPLLEQLAALPRDGTWGDWLRALEALARRALREPARVLEVLAELLPLAPVGPVSLSEVRLLLAERLSELPVPPPARRFGRVFVGPAEAARGLSFEVVFVPGLAERVFPHKISEDPLLLDAARVTLGLAERAARVAAERLQLRLAVGAARRQLVLAWARLDQQTSRPRVPSFYGLELLRAAEG
ncbi:MAG: ATP-dependent helicase, partial [Deltaproteobacteria bacterium]|nr:ATP-dependent helicase [Deltaproteobacteria bacterium]